MRFQRRLDTFKSAFESGGPSYNVFRERMHEVERRSCSGIVQAEFSGNREEESKMTTNVSSALVTGGTSGIGRAAARKLAQLGIHVIVVGRNAERGEKTVAEIRAAGGKADVISADLHD